MGGLSSPSSGVATDDGVLMATYLDDRFRKAPHGCGLRAAVVKAGMKRHVPP